MTRTGAIGHAAAFFLAAVSVVGLSVGVLPADEPEKKNGDASDTELVLTADERRLLDMINEVRTKAELKPLTPSARLFRIARAHSQNMAKHKELNHDLDDKTPFQRMDDVGYKYARAGENIAESTGPLREVVGLWMNSPPHKKNILTAEFRETGLGIAVGADDVRYYTQDFGTPAGGP